MINRVKKLRFLYWQPGVFLAVDAMQHKKQIPLAAYVLNYTDKILRELKRRQK